VAKSSPCWVYGTRFPGSPIGEGMKKGLKLGGEKKMSQKGLASIQGGKSGPNLLLFMNRAKQRENP